MPIQSVASLLDLLRQYRLLDAGQLAQLAAPGRFADSRALAKELLQRGWVTAFQMNQLFQDKAAELVLGQYVLLERLGEGGMGQVFKARQVRLNRVVAVKLIRKDRLAKPDAVRRFQREVQAAAQLSHPNVVAAYDADQVGDTHFFAMEYVEGTDLAKMVKEFGPQPLPHACNFINQAAQGLQHAYDRGLVHRDIKPSNLLVAWTASRGAKSDAAAAGTAPAMTGRPIVKILDMGLARLDGAEDSVSQLTQEGSVMGTLDYLAPEQAQDSRQADIRSDLYSLGCTFYFLLTGQVPFPGGTATEKLLKHRLDEPPAVETLRPDAPAWVCAIVRKLLTKKPEDRFQTPAELSEALEEHGTAGHAANGHISPLSQRPSGLRGPAPVAVMVPGQVGAPTARAVPVTHVEDETATSALPEFQRRNRWRFKAMLAGAAGLAVLLLLVVVIIVSTRKAKFGPLPSAEQTSTDDLTRLRSHLSEFDANELRRYLVAVQGRHASDPAAMQAAELMTLVPSPLDRLRSDQVSAEDRGFAGGVDDLVAVVGDQRLRAWGNLTELAISPDRRIATGADDGIVRIWNSSGGQARAIDTKERVRFLGFLAGGARIAANDGVWDTATGDRVVGAPAGQGVGISLDGRLLAIRAPDGSHVSLWPAGSGQEKTLQGGHARRSPIRAFAFSADEHGRFAATVGDDLLLVVWETSTGKPLHTLKTGHTKPIERVWLFADGKLALSVSTQAGDNTREVKLWDVLTERELPPPKDFPAGVFVVESAADGKTIVLRSGQDTRLWDVAAGRVRATPLPRSPTDLPWWNFAFSPTGELLATAAYGGEEPLKLWDVATGLPRPLKGHFSPTVRLAFFPSGKKLAAASNKGFITLWNVETGTQEFPGAEPSFMNTKPDFREPLYTGLVFSHDGAALALASEDAVWLIDTAAGKTRAAPREQRNPFTLAFAPDDSTLASSSRQIDETKLWDVMSGQSQWTSRPGNLGCAFCPDGKILSASNTQIKLIDAASGRGLWTWNLAARPQYAQAQFSVVALAPDGTTLATLLAPTGQILLWDVAAGKDANPRELPIRGLAPLTFTWAPNSQLLAVRDRDGSCKLWDVTAKKSRTLRRSDVWAFSADSKTMVTTSSPAERLDELLVYDIANEREKQRLDGGHIKRVNSIACSLDGKFVATAGQDGRVIVWEPESRKRIIRQWQLPGPVLRVAFAPDGRHLATLNGNGSAYILRISPPR